MPEPEVVVASPDRSAAMSGGTPAWISLALGVFIFGSLFVIASVLVLSLIPLYLSTRSVTRYEPEVTNSLKPTFSSSWSPTESSLSAANTAAIARKLETAAGISPNVLSINAATATSSGTTSGRRRRQESPDPPHLPHCNGSSEKPTNIDFDVTINFHKCNKSTPAAKRACKLEVYNEVKTKLENVGPVSFEFELPNGTVITVQAQRCRKYPGAAPGLRPPAPANSCLNCTTTNNTVSDWLTPTFLSSWSPRSSSVSALNTDGLARQLENVTGLSNGTLSVYSATATTDISSGSSRRRRQDSIDPANLPHCNGSSSSATNIGFNISINYKICDKEAPSQQQSCKTDLYNLVKSKLDNLGNISFVFQLPDGSNVIVAAQRCRKFPGAATNSCLTCTITINTGINNFFIGTRNATNLTSIYTGNGTISPSTTYVGYPASAFSGSCADLCRTINTVCDSDYALCSLDVSNYGVCSIVASGSPCPGISIYNDPNGRTGANPGDPITCSGSSNYCCCMPRT